LVYKGNDFFENFCQAENRIQLEAKERLEFEASAHLRHAGPHAGPADTATEGGGGRLDGHWRRRAEGGESTPAHLMRAADYLSQQVFFFFQI